jgi:hypothetical protein
MGDALLEQLDFPWQAAIRPCIAGLDDDTYRWDPVPGCWTLHDDGHLDWRWPAPEPPPFTNLAWRLCHLSGAMAERASRHFGDGSYRWWDATFPTTASGALAFADESYEAWTGPIRQMDDERLARPLGQKEPAFADHPFSDLVLHLNREVIHHGAEVCLLRDLHRATFGD